MVKEYFLKQERQNMREIIILKKIPRLKLKSVCAPILFPSAFLLIIARHETYKTCGNKLKKLFNNCRRWWSVPGTNSFHKEIWRVQPKRSEWNEVEAKILKKNVCIYTANNYNIRRGLLTGFVMYQVRGSVANDERSSRGGKMTKRTRR